MGPLTKTHSVPHPNIGINPIKTRKMASPHANTEHLMVMVFHTSSISHHLSESDEQLSFSGPTSTSTPNKTDGRPYLSAGH